MPEQLEIMIDESGKVAVNAIGFTGPVCNNVLQGLKERLGGEVKELQFKKEFYEETGVDLRFLCG